MLNNYFKVGLLCAALMPLSACIDNDIEISDVDTTTQVKVDNLTLPVNLDVVTLNDIFDIDNSGRITTVNIDGKEFWAVTEHGEIKSENIDIPKFEAQAPTINASQAKFYLTGLPSAGKTRAAAANVVENDYTFREFDPQHINFSTSVDKAIVEIDDIFMSEMNFAIDFTATGVPSNLDLEFTTLKINILKGLELTSLSNAYTYSYVPSSGLLTISNLKCDANHKAHIEFKATKISNVTDASGAKSIQLNNGNLSFNTEVKLEDALIHTVLHIDPSLTQPTENVLVFNVKTSVGNIKADYISGTVDYTLKGNDLKIDPVELSDLPAFLDDPRTDLRLANPQIYLNLNNPVAPYNLYYQTGLQFVSLRGNNDRAYFPASGQGVTIATKATSEGPYNFVLSPSAQDLNTPDFYKNGLQHVPFTDLGDLLSGNGLPDRIEINLVNPGLPRQKVVKFKLDNSIPGIHGYYDFVAPLGLKTGSTIVYSDSKGDWESDELKKLTVTKLVIDADAFSEIPLEAELTAYPLDSKGNRIDSFPVRGTLAGTPGKQHITLESSGTFSDLGGVTFEAVVHPSASTPLTPNLTIRLENVKATVSGYYTTDF